MIDETAPPLAKLAEPLGADEIHLWSLVHRPDQQRQPLKQILGRYLGCAAEAVVLVDDVHGRPGLAGGADAPLLFNWSHSGDRALVAVARFVQPGIDVERRGRRGQTRVEAIANRFFSAQEAHRLAAIAPQDREDEFLRLWTAKEALLKAHGQGLSFGLHRLAIDTGGDELVLRAFEAEDVHAWQLHALPVDKRHVAAIGWRGPPMRLRWMNRQASTS